MASSDFLEELDEGFFQCSICLEQLKDPKLLPCGHRYCLECLRDVARGGNDAIKCPECREEHVLPASGVDGLRADFFVKSMIEFVELKKPTEEDPPPERDNPSQEVTLYIQNLHDDIDEERLRREFASFGNITSAKVIKNNKGVSRGFGYVYFSSQDEATQAMAEMNGHVLSTKPLKVSVAQPKEERDNRFRGVNLYIRNLDDDIDDERLSTEFARFGNITSVKVMKNDKGVSRGYGFVCFSSKDEATKAVTEMNGHVISTKPLYVAPFQPKEQVNRSQGWKLYIRNLEDDIDNERLRKEFARLGNITSANVVKNAGGVSRGYGFVCFSSQEEATKAVNDMNGRVISTKPLYVAFDNRKEERDNRSQGVKLYIRNLEDDIDDERLKKEFARFGNITSANVVMNAEGVSRGFGFVYFSSQEEATKAMKEMNGHVISTKPLHVAFDKRKERDVLSYLHFKEALSAMLDASDCLRLAHFFALPEGPVDAITGSTSPTESLLQHLEEKSIIQSSNVSQLTKGLEELNITMSLGALCERYMNTRGHATEYRIFLTELSTHLTRHLPAQLCDYFNFNEEKRDLVISSENPGLELLTELDVLGYITKSDVSRLLDPLQQHLLLQAGARVEEYQTSIAEQDVSSTASGVVTLDEKLEVFLKCLKRKAKSYYETMSPLPWRKSCRWRTTDLFVASGLVLTDSKSRLTSSDVDPSCKLHYTDIFTHRQLSEEARIIIEGEPGSGKTMLATQLAYDWSNGKLVGIEMLILIPLKLVKRMTIIQAIKQFNIPDDAPLSEDDIKVFLVNKRKKKIYLVLDGVEEYNPSEDGPSEVAQIMGKQMFSAISVILTARSDFINDIVCPILKLGRFEEEERDAYLQKVFPDDKDEQLKVKEFLENSSLLLDLCSIPLLFVLVVHNKDSLGDVTGQPDSVSPFMKKIINILCKENISDGEAMRDSLLAKLAFKGLCMGHQQLFWSKEYFDDAVGDLKKWTDSGILVVEDDSSVDREWYDRIPPGGANADTPEDKPTMRESDSLDVTNQAVSASTDEDDTELGKNRRNPPQSEYKAANSALNTDQVPLRVRFLHKVIQEWFAAKHFASVLTQTAEDNRQQLLGRHMANISPSDLHYVLRFTCFHCSLSCHLIIEYLLNEFKADDGTIPEHIMDCIFLSFAEYSGDKKNPDLVKVIHEVCDEIITIRASDSRLLQQSNVSLLKYAASAQIGIRHLKLFDTVIVVKKETLHFNTGVMLDTLPTLRAIEITRWDQKLDEKDYRALITFSVRCQVGKIYLNFPSQPPHFEPSEVSIIKLWNPIVEWKIGERLIHTLNTGTGEWMLKPFVGCAIQDGSRRRADLYLDSAVAVSGSISTDGGVLEIPNTSVKLEVPRGALEKEQIIGMKLVGDGSLDEAVPVSFASNSTVVVDLLPNGLTFWKAVTLVLPHCLKLKKEAERHAKVYKSHQEKGGTPIWEETDCRLHRVDESHCVIDLFSFTWVTVRFRDEDVLAKHVCLFAARADDIDENTTQIIVGCYPAIKGKREIVQKERGLDIKRGVRITFLKKDEGPRDLHMRFIGTEPGPWVYNSLSSNPQTIDYENVAMVPMLESMLSFVMVRTEARACLLIFEAFQGTGTDFKPTQFWTPMKNVPTPTQQTTQTSNMVAPTAPTTQAAITSVVPATTVQVARTGQGQPTQQLAIQQPPCEVLPAATEALENMSLQDESSLPMSRFHNLPAEDIQQRSHYVRKRGEVDIAMLLRARCAEAVKREDLQTLSKKIPKEWEEVARNLSIPEEEIERIGIDQRGNTGKAAFQMLLSWTRWNSGRATYTSLVEALRKAGRRDLGQEIMRQHNSRTAFQGSPSWYIRTDQESANVSPPNVTEREQTQPTMSQDTTAVHKIEESEEQPPISSPMDLGSPAGGTTASTSSGQPMDTMLNELRAFCDTKGLQHPNYECIDTENTCSCPVATKYQGPPPTQFVPIQATQKLTPRKTSNPEDTQDSTLSLPTRLGGPALRNVPLGEMSPNQSLFDGQSILSAALGISQPFQAADQSALQGEVTEEQLLGNLLLGPPSLPGVVPEPKLVGEEPSGSKPQDQIPQTQPANPPMLDEEQAESAPRSEESPGESPVPRSGEARTRGRRQRAKGGAKLAIKFEGSG